MCQENQTRRLFSEILSLLLRVWPRKKRLHKWDCERNGPRSDVKIWGAVSGILALTLETIRPSTCEKKCFSSMVRAFSTGSLFYNVQHKYSFLFNIWSGSQDCCGWKAWADYDLVGWLVPSIILVIEIVGTMCLHGATEKAGKEEE